MIKTLFIFQTTPFFGSIVMNLVQTLEQQLEAFKREYEKFERGNKSAGTRARKALQDIKRTCQDLRVSIQGSKKEDAGSEE
ncbi:MAG TPA: hypothetical protein PK616_03270 [Fibrobacteraceae bacterium]|nr:hypothetical protein [Fibrobacteraceae bacterium]